MVSKRSSITSLSSSHSAPTKPSPLSAPPSLAPSLLRRPSVQIPQQRYYKPKDLNVFQRGWALYEASFAISMLEPWEKIMLHSVAILLLSFVYLGISTYLPAGLRRLAGRIDYYINGL